ncbi:MAG: DUF72 domain-containing protein [Thermoanaerobaculia bacterium]|nr:DUF72 domain-containing protein [Thermoanaerobaculia bacterium]
MQLLAGTSGYAYKEWKGSFYPDKIAPEKMLAYYAQRLPAVEINNTFYRMPKSSVLENWRDQVPEGFRFVLKASRRITHQKRLADVDEPLGYLLASTEVLGKRMGALLFQTPPYLKKDVPRLRDFLARLASGPPAAFEFRHPSWFDDEVHAALADADAALCLADGDNEERNPPWVATAGWGYLRLRREGYDDGELARWAERIAGEAWRSTYVFFKHEDAGAGPALAARMLGIAAA